MRIRYFAWLRHRVGRAEEQIELPEGIATVGALRTLLAERHRGFAEATTVPGIIRCAVNQEYAEDDAPVGPKDEVAFFPPVTGG